MKFKFLVYNEEKPLNARKTCSFGIGRGQKLGPCYSSESKMFSRIDIFPCRLIILLHCTGLQVKYYSFLLQFSNRHCLQYSSSVSIYEHAGGTMHFCRMVYIMVSLKWKSSLRTTRLMRGKPIGLRVSDDFSISYGMLHNIWIAFIAVIFLLVSFRLHDM